MFRHWRESYCILRTLNSFGLGGPPPPPPPTMRIPTLVLSLALVAAFAFATTASAQDPTGVWKMNPAKSKYSPGPATKSEVTWMFDGKDHPVTGNPNSTSQAYTKVDAMHYTVVSKIGTTVSVTSKVELAKDGKSRTSTQTGTDAQGKAVNNMIWYDKQ